MVDPNHNRAAFDFLYDDTIQDDDKLPAVISSPNSVEQYRHVGYTQKGDGSMVPVVEDVYSGEKFAYDPDSNYDVEVHIPGTSGVNNREHLPAVRKPAGAFSVQLTRPVPGGDLYFHGRTDADAEEGVLSSLFGLGGNPNRFAAQPQVVAVPVPYPTQIPLQYSQQYPNESYPTTIISSPTEMSLPRSVEDRSRSRSINELLRSKTTSILAYTAITLVGMTTSYSIISGEPTSNPVTAISETAHAYKRVGDFIESIKNWGPF